MPEMRLAVNLGSLDLVESDAPAAQPAGRPQAWLNLRTQRGQLSLGDGGENEFFLACDVKKKRARFRLAGGDTSKLSLRISGDLVLGKRPRLDASLLLTVAGRQLALNLPEVELVPRTHAGQLYLEYIFPVLKGSF